MPNQPSCTQLTGVTFTDPLGVNHKGRVGLLVGICGLLHLASGLCVVVVEFVCEEGKIEVCGGGGVNVVCVDFGLSV